MKAAETSGGASDRARAYWSDAMDKGYRFMEEMRIYPLKECGEGLAPLEEALSGVDVRFSTTLLGELFPRIFYVREGLCSSLRAAAQELNGMGWGLKIEDGYRTPEMQRSLSGFPRVFDALLRMVTWELGGRKPSPELMLKRVTAVIATRCRIGTHISGSAIDISVYDRTTGKEIERGGSYIEISVRTPMESPFITPEELANRHKINGILRRHGWHPYPYEFWVRSRKPTTHELANRIRNHIARLRMPGNCVPARGGGEQPEARHAAHNEGKAHPMSFEM